MEVNFRKIVSLAGVICGCMTSLFAAQDLHSNGMSGDDSDMNQPKQITPAASPRVENGADVFLTADFIYWSVREEGLAFATSGFAPGGVGTTTLSKGQTYYPGFRWRPGFKVGLGLDLGHDGWDIYAQYTWMNAPKHTRTATSTTDSNNELVSTWVFDPANEMQSVNYASGAWSLNFNTADLDIGRQYFISHYLVLRPFVGLKASWQKQRNTAYYQETVTTTSYTATNLSMKERFFGIGLRSGLNANFHFDKNWSLYGDCTLSALASHFNVSHSYTTWTVTNTDTTPTASETLLLANYKTVLNTIKPVLETGMGLAWDYWFNDDSYHVGLSLGWEQQLWWGMNKFNNLLNGDSNGDLSMQGITFKFRFDF